MRKSAKICDIIAQKPVIYSKIKYAELCKNMGNNPMVGATVAVAVAVEEAMK